MTPESYLIYLLALAAFFATPPDTSQLLIMSNSMRHGLRRSLNTVAGDLTANCLQMTVAAFGLTAILSVSLEAITIVKWMGVAYLTWIGIKLFMDGSENNKPEPAKAGHLFRQGFLTSLANPYAVLFFGALFPQFMDPTLPIIPQLLLLGGTYLLVDGSILLIWGMLASKAISKLKAIEMHHVNKISGSLMIAAALMLAAKTVTNGAEQ